MKHTGTIDVTWDRHARMLAGTQRKGDEPIWKAYSRSLQACWDNKLRVDVVIETETFEDGQQHIVAVWHPGTGIQIPDWEDEYIKQLENIIS